MTLENKWNSRGSVLSWPRAASRLRAGRQGSLPRTTRLAIAAIALFAGGCASHPTTQQIGTATGAVVGGIVGNAVTVGSTAGTVAGAGVGAVIGSEIGRKLERK